MSLYFINCFQSINAILLRMFITGALYYRKTYLLYFRNRKNKILINHFLLILFKRKKKFKLFMNNYIFLWILQKPQFQRYVHKLVIMNLINAICYWNSYFNQHLTSWTSSTTKSSKITSYLYLMKTEETTVIGISGHRSGFSWLGY